MKVARGSSEVDLHKHLLSAYDKTVRWGDVNKTSIRLKLISEDFIRPSEHHNISLQVIFGLALTQIVDIVSHIHYIHIKIRLE